MTHHSREETEDGASATPDMEKQPSRNQADNPSVKKVVINVRFGGFGLSDTAYEWLINHGVRVGKYHKEPRNPKTGLYDIIVPENEGEVIFDRDLEAEPSEINRALRAFAGRYWETWIDKRRDWPLLIECVEALGKKANSRSATLKIVEIPADVNYEIDEYDGLESIHEVHRSWS
jgi:hypothetical protein